MSLKQLIIKTKPRPSLHNIVQIQAIGSGTYSSVFLVEINGNEMVAKRFHDTENIGRINREVIILAGMKHFPHIMHIDEFLSYNDRYFIVSKFYGKQLDIMMNHSRKEVKLIIAELLYALSLLDALKIVHRDVKPENILLDRDGLTLIDFGLSLPISTLEQRAGTLQYESPENFLFGISCRNSDVFSAGVLLLNLLARRKMLYSSNREDHFGVLQKFSPGFALFSESYTFQGLEKIRMEEEQIFMYRSKFEVPEVSDALEKMLCADPDRRPTAIDCLSFPLFNEVRDTILKLPYISVYSGGLRIAEEQVCNTFRMCVGEFMAGRE